MVIGHWSLVIGYWSLVIGHLLLVISHWLLVIGYFKVFNQQITIKNAYILQVTLYGISLRLG
ncbi:MAG: D-galactonate transporter [Symploca sp. SIO2G7]|nr:D-galactonate transporter [Symploca sp. SIO2G7]